MKAAQKLKLEESVAAKQLTRKMRVVLQLEKAAKRDADPARIAKVIAERKERQPKWMNSIVVAKKIKGREVRIGTGIVSGAKGPRLKAR